MVKVGDIKSLSKDWVKMKDKLHVECLINEIIKGGPSKLQVITDFDRTLTRPHHNGKECLSSFGIFHLCNTLPTEYLEAAKALFDHYRPLEINPSLSVEQKSIYMEEWTQKEADLLNFDLDRKEIDIAVKKADVSLREGTDTMLKSLVDLQVPVLVFSAGCGDTVSAVLKHHQVMYPNMHVIANFLKFDGPKVVGFFGDIIHTFNKNEGSIKNTDYFHDLAGRDNIILMGDVVGDAQMAVGVKNSKAVLKIGFLQDHVEESLQEYMDHFDIVLVDDQTMNLTNELLGMILPSPPEDR